MQSFLPAVAEQLFQDIKKIYQETAQSKTSCAKAVTAKPFSITSQKSVIAECDEAPKLSEQTRRQLIFCPEGILNLNPFSKVTYFVYLLCYTLT